MEGRRLRVMTYKMADRLSTFFSFATNMLQKKTKQQKTAKTNYTIAHFKLTQKSIIFSVSCKIMFKASIYCLLNKIYCVIKHFANQNSITLHARKAEE